MKVVLYARVSTVDQSDRGISLESQQAKLAAYAQLYELEVIESITDSAESAKSLARSGLQRALRMLNDNQASGMVVVKLDRLTRSVADWQVLIDKYFGEKAGKQLFSVADSIDTRTASGRLVLNVLLSVAQWERETTSERTSAVLQHKISNGERCGKLRYGYDLAADRKKLIPNSDEQCIIDLISSLRTKGLSLRKIATQLSESGVLTKEGGKTWTHTAVNRILQRSRIAA